MEILKYHNGYAPLAVNLEGHWGKTPITLCSIMSRNQGRPMSRRFLWHEPHAITAEHVLGFSAQGAASGARNCFCVKGVFSAGSVTDWAT